jgi:hypothetical protein
MQKKKSRRNSSLLALEFLETDHPLFNSKGDNCLKSSQDSA